MQGTYVTHLTEEVLESYRMEANHVAACDSPGNRTTPELAEAAFNAYDRARKAVIDNLIQRGKIEPDQSGFIYICSSTGAIYIADELQ